MEQENNDLQVFRLSKELISSSLIDNNHIKSIYLDMCEADVAYPPYQKFALEFDIEAFLELLRFACLDGNDEYQRQEIRNQLSDVRKWFIEYDIGKPVLCTHSKAKHFFYSPFVAGCAYQVLHNNQVRGHSFNQERDVDDTLFSIFWWIFAFFMVLLSTKNIKKTTKIHECMKRKKIPDSKKYREGYPYTTTLTIGKITENYDGSEFTGVSRRPHLRRGHVRTQHYGPRNEMTKKVFIPSVFVNGSEDLKSNRVAYNVSFAA